MDYYGVIHFVLQNHLWMVEIQFSKFHSYIINTSHSQLINNTPIDKQNLALEIEDVYAFGIIIMEVLLGENETYDYIINNKIYIESGLQPHPALENDKGNY